jgi:hypothetical protein
MTKYATSKIVILKYHIHIEKTSYLQLEKSDTFCILYIYSVGQIRHRGELVLDRYVIGVSFLIHIII